MKKNYSPYAKYSRQTLQKDYILLRNILETKHPAIYWYTPKDSMDGYFDQYYHAISDSMNEGQFAWQILAPLIEKIHCGHTSVGFSKEYVKWVQGKKFPSFPLYVKVWNDTMAVIGNLHQKDSIFKRGTLITSVNGLSNQQLISRIFGYLPEDGYADNSNYIRLSANFPYYHRNIFGLSKTYQVGYLDSNNIRRVATVPAFTPVKDTTKKDSAIKVMRPPKQPKQNRLLQYRSMQIDSSGKFAVMTLNGFTKGRLRRFFKRSFKELRSKNIDHLVLDMRNNGGGKVGLSTLLTKYISRQPFKVADTVYAVSHSLAPYTKYIKGRFLNNIELFFASKKRTDGKYHLGLLEKKLYKPKQNNHYNGNVYVLTNGPTFSAAALFCNAVKGQEGIKLVGEETGGGWHGNSGIMIPDITLPNTHLRVRLPLFKLVQYKHVPKTGTGIIPDIYVGTSYEALLRGYDKKMEVVRKMILENK
ncbi:S41 family peptidase [Ferruginibacter sp. HRS2-29]|uniref:S41 family peptidase n=1 Tax=Ferruginibacter sp. HRS2-29 TaxID=2487334 RepID=UPI0020CC872E|nr:S41 family peptidase [Ferruginibacter sp. HRS2-29]